MITHSYNKDCNIAKLQYELQEAGIFFDHITKINTTTYIHVENGWSNLVQEEVQAIVDNHTTLFLHEVINNRITYYQSVASDLMRQLYTDNTLAGITTQQSDQMVDDFSDVLIRIKEGLFPTAIYRLQSKEPSGFVTQELIDNWIARIQSYMG
jgi:predicted sulfurtransferase